MKNLQGCTARTGEQVGGFIQADGCTPAYSMLLSPLDALALGEQARNN